MDSKNNLAGIGFIVLAMLILSLQGIVVKWIGGDYSIMEIVLFRSFVALPITILLYRLEGNRGLPTTKRHKLEYTRGFFFFLSYTTAFMGIAALPLADVAAIRNSGPLMITLLSVIILHEKVESRRWLALGVGFIGVLLVIRPGSVTFNIGSVFILISVLFYALNTILTRKLRTTDSSATMAYYSSIVYLVAAIVLLPLALLIGEIPNAHPSIAFLLRPWRTPSLLDWCIMSGLGLVWAAGMYFIARAYSTAQASIVAPFEYTNLLINVMWDLLLWHIFPTLLTWAGAFLTIVSGLYILYRDRQTQSIKTIPESQSVKLDQE